MKVNILQITVLAMVLLGTNIGSSLAQPITGTELADAKKAIAASNAIYFKSFEKNDASIFINRYADDCIIMLPNAPEMKGQAGALAFFNAAYKKAGLRDGSFQTVNVYGLGNGYVAEEGFWKSIDKNHKVFDHGKYLVLWKKTSKGWKMFRDSFSSDGQ